MSCHFPSIIIKIYPFLSKKELHNTQFLYAVMMEYPALETILATIMSHIMLGIMDMDMVVNMDSMATVVVICMDMVDTHISRCCSIIVIW